VQDVNQARCPHQVVGSDGPDGAGLEVGDMVGTAARRELDAPRRGVVAPIDGLPPRAILGYALLHQPGIQADAAVVAEPDAVVLRQPPGQALALDEQAHLIQHTQRSAMHRSYVLRAEDGREDRRAQACGLYRLPVHRPEMPESEMPRMKYFCATKKRIITGATWSAESAIR
jgi:hypothetical protein